MWAIWKLPIELILIETFYSFGTQSCLAAKVLKGTAILMIAMFDMKDLNER